MRKFCHVKFKVVKKSFMDSSVGARSRLNDIIIIHNIYYYRRWDWRRGRRETHKIVIASFLLGTGGTNQHLTSFRCFLCDAKKLSAKWWRTKKKCWGKKTLNSTCRGNRLVNLCKIENRQRSYKIINRRIHKAALLLFNGPSGSKGFCVSDHVLSSAMRDEGAFQGSLNSSILFNFSSLNPCTFTPGCHQSSHPAAP